jgi:hypothetical protein
MSTFTLDKTLYNKRDYNIFIDTSFTELVPPQEELPSSLTVSDFFALYNTLFFDIPKNGETNSHEYLIQQSSEYLGRGFIETDIQPLVDEITFLRQELLETKQQLTSLLGNSTLTSQTLSNISNTPEL